MSTTFEMKGKSALVGGSSAGIGLATAQLLAEQGANVTLIARNEERLKTAVSSLPKAEGHQHGYLIADYSNVETLRISIEEFAKNNTVDLLVNNTGGPPAGPAHLASVEEYISAFTQHLICNQIITQAVVGGMKERKFGRIVNVISTSVKVPLPNLGVSNTIRGAVGNWSKTLANELGKFNITVNNVLPGATQTDRLKSIIENKSKKLNIAFEEVEKEMLSEVPMARFAKPQEVASAVVFLCSSWASYINGINIPVDGGRTPNL